MELLSIVDRIRSGKAAGFPTEANTIEFAKRLDSQDHLSHLRDQFLLPTKASLKKKSLTGESRRPGVVAQNGASGANGHSNGYQNGNGASATHTNDDEPCIYFCGNSLGAQPKAVREYLNAQLETWASVAVGGHFSAMENSPLTAWQDLAEDCAKKSCDILGALPSELVIMNTLTANLHFMMASFYCPSEKRHKIILEWKPFPSDFYAIHSHIQWHGLDPKLSMVLIEPDENFLISTEKVLAIIDEHGEETALIMLPGIQYWSGQLFDIPRITKYAQERGIVVGWDLAHAAGNVELQLHDWNVDFACWCTYKYINAGPGSTAGAFIHEKHGKVDYSSDPDSPIFRHRLAGWYGGDKSVRFNMDNNFMPTPGAGGFQMSNPSAIDLASLSASLSVFGMTSMKELRSKSLALTAYAQYLLDEILSDSKDQEPPFRVITPRDPAQRGAQLSVLLKDGLLEGVTEALLENAVVCDKRKPNVIRVAPVPLYSRFQDVWTFMQILRQAVGL